MANELVQIKFLGETDIRFYAIDGSFSGILKPNEIFSLSRAAYEADFLNDPRYELIEDSKTKSKK